MRICIYGAGAIGGWIGVKLARAGHAISFVARGATLAQIQAHGMLLVEDGKTHRAQVQVSDGTADLGQQDLVILAVKSPSVLDVARHLSPLLGADTHGHDRHERCALVVFARLWRRLRKDTIAGC